MQGLYQELPLWGRVLNIVLHNDYLFTLQGFPQTGNQLIYFLRGSIMQKGNP
jgi:hypothetical protein